VTMHHLEVTQNKQCRPQKCNKYCSNKQHQKIKFKATVTNADTTEMRQVQVNQNKAVQHLRQQVHECKLQVQVQGQNDKVYATAGSQLENS
jgi:hypothetical protein